MTTATETISLIRDDQTDNRYFQVSQGDGRFYLCDGDGDKVELAAWSLVKVIGEVDSDSADEFFATVEPYLAGAKFLEVWEEAGRPQVQQINYPRSGNATHNNLRHGDVRATARMTCPMEFKSEHGFVSLEWTSDPIDVFGACDAFSKLMFELPEA